MRLSQRRARMMKRNAMKPVELLNGNDKEKTNEILTKTFNDADTDSDGALGPEEFKVRCT
jgi:Ca2+-binding EF-hand superfamily protein